MLRGVSELKGWSRGFPTEDAKGRVGLGDLRCGGVSDMEARPRWPFTGSSLLETSEGRFSLC